LLRISCASPRSRPSAAGAAACGSPNVRRAGEAGKRASLAGPHERFQDTETRCNYVVRSVAMHSVIQKCRQASGSLPKASKVREKVPGPGPVPRLASQRRSQTPRTRTLAFESANSSTCGDDRPSAARTSSQGRTPVHGRRRAREHPSSSHAHGNGAQARATGTARMDGAPEGGGPPRAAIQRGPCPKVPAEFDRRPLAGARGRV
jgi:hypothetical protein